MAMHDYFLKIDGIDGESQDSKHKNDIDVIDFTWGATQSGASHTGGGSGAGKVHMMDFQFEMKVNKSSPKLLLACAEGQHIKKAVLVARKAGKGQQEFYKITMTGVIVSSYSTAGIYGTNKANSKTLATSGLALAEDILIEPTDQVSLNFTTIKFEYFGQKADGTLDGAITAGWDLKSNEELRASN